MSKSENKTGKSRHHALSALQNVPVFSTASMTELEAIAREATFESVDRGAHLIRAGEHADTLYILLRGRLVVMAGEKAIAEVAPGEPVGELGFFADRDRTADVIASRNSQVLALTREAYDRIVSKHPSLAGRMMAVMAARLADVTANSRKLRPGAGRVVAMVAAAGGTIPDELLEGLGSALGASPPNAPAAPDLRMIMRQDCPAGENGSSGSIGDWISSQETAEGQMLLVGDGGDASAWNDAILANADTIYLVCEKALGRKGPVPLSALEKRIEANTLPARIHHLIWRDRKARPIRNSERWLSGRVSQLHHHVALDSEEDFARIVRFIRGDALGLVLCGGGAFGTAHLGAIKALQEAGILIDMYGGTSVGAAMAAALAVGKPPDEAMDLCEEIFLRSKAMSRLTVPLHSVLDHKRFDEMMNLHYGDHLVEDLPFNYFAVATSLTRNDLHLIKRGPLWKAVRASTSIPAVFPPVIKEDGEVLIDGALVDNVPINVMRDLKPGPNVILNFRKSEPWRVTSSYEKLPGRGEALRRAVYRKKSDPRFPSVVSVLSRTMVITARRVLEETDMSGDVLLDIPTLPKMGFLEWKRGREQFNTAYQSMKQALEEGDERLGKDAGSLERIRVAGDFLEMRSANA